jgi:predicted CoA-binding protein
MSNSFSDQPITLVLGASENPSRYAHMAVERLQEKGHHILAVGLKTGMIGETPIVTSIPTDIKIDTVTLYVGPKHQTDIIPQIIALHPRRVIFNPGTENADFIQQAQRAGIETEIACTLVLLSTGNY